MGIARLLLVSVLTAFVSSAWAAPGKIALVQYDADRHFDLYEKNLAALSGYAKDAVSKGANIIVFPEGSSYGYADDDHLWCSQLVSDPRCVDVRKAAEMIPGGKTEAYWSQFAKMNQVYVLYNLPEQGENGGYYNTTAVSGPQGYVTRYRKRELYRTDKFYASAGSEPKILVTPYGKFGIAICMDGTYRGALEEYKRLGADAVILPMDWDDDPQGSFAGSIHFRARAKEAGIDLYVSDEAAWDSSGKYPKSGKNRERDGLPANAVNTDGITYSLLNY